MGWICTRDMTIKRAGKYVQVRGGDPVPEAENWPTKKALERLHFIRWAKDPTPSPEAKSVSATVVPESTPELPLESAKPKPEGKETPWKKGRSRRRGSRGKGK